MQWASEMRAFLWGLFPLLLELIKHSSLWVIISGFAVSSVGGSEALDTFLKGRCAGEGKKRIILFPKILFTVPL